MKPFSKTVVCLVFGSLASCVNVSADYISDISIFSRKINEIGYVAKGPIERIWEEGTPELCFTLEFAEGVIRENEAVFVYVVQVEGFFDFVFFSRKMQVDDVLSYFVDRWNYVATGILNGYIHFNEDYLARFVEDIELMDHLYGGTAVGQEHKNRVFNDFRAAYLRRYANSLSMRVKSDSFSVHSESEQKEVRK